MAMHALGVLPLIHRLSSNVMNRSSTQMMLQHVWSCPEIRSWWKHLVEVGPQYGYFPNASKTWMIVKKEKFEEAQAIFEETGVDVT